MDAEKKIVAIILEHFPNGIRDDFIDTNKVLKLYRTKYAEEVSLKKIADVIRARGIEDGGRFYFVSAEDVKSIKWLFDEILETNSIVYYSVVRVKHADFFVRRSVFSPKILRKVLSKKGDYFYSKDFCATDKSTRLEYEVEKIFRARGNSLTLGELQEKFSYVPPEKISVLLDDARKYLKINSGKFFLVSEIHFDEEEIQAARKKIFSLLDASESAFLEDCDLSSTFALNPELTEKDLLNVLYEKFFSAEFTRRGKKIFKKGALDKRTSDGAVGHIRNFLADKSEVSAEELFAFAKNFAPAQSNNIPLSVAHKMMIRAEENLFVRDPLIKFNISAVDEALTPFVKGKIIPLRSVTSFTGFPSIAGYSWNLFLLESFLRKYSRRYAYASPSNVANSSNIGAIHPKSMKFEDYLEVQIAVVVQEKIPLEKSAVEKFLIGQGFRVKRIDTVTEEIIAGAQEKLRR